MADRFIGSLLVRGANGKTSPVRYNIVDATYAEAKTALDALATALDAVTDGTIVQRTLSYVYNESNAAGAGDVFERLTIACYVNQTGEVDKFAVVNIPAPSIGNFLGTTGEQRDVLDLADEAVQDYIVAISENATVSDGEVINIAIPTAGMKGGRRTLANVKLG